MNNQRKKEKKGDRENQMKMKTPNRVAFEVQRERMKIYGSFLEAI